MTLNNPTKAKKTYLSYLIAFAGMWLISGAIACTGHDPKSAHHDEHAPTQAHAMHHEMAAITSDESFLRGMIAHHQEAIDSSALILARTDNPTLAQFTQQVIMGQSQEIMQMKKWYASTQGKPYAADGMYMPMMSESKNLQTSTASADIAYMQGMIAHHEGAITMAQQILPITQNAEIQKMAQAIIETQSKEIALLKNWLVDVPLPTAPAGHVHH